MESIIVVMLVWLLAAVWVFALVMMGIMGDLTPAESILGSVVALLLAFAAARHAFPHAALFSLLALSVGAVALPMIRNYLNRQAHAQMDAELVEQACRAVEFDPKNWGALVQLATFCYRHDLMEHAVYYLEQAVQQAPLYTHNEKRMLRDWQHELQHFGTRVGYTPCLNCGARNPIGPLRCARCHELLLPMLVRGRWIPKQLMLKVVRVWVIGTIGIALSLIAAGSLPGSMALVMVPLILLLTGGSIAWVLRKR
ncbi:MAG: hypothetical protein NZL85_08460 [Fimbriimonadales bacterium]|nr:hypothetical protein [Fimbriimonadales bacterium]